MAGTSGYNDRKSRERAAQNSDQVEVAALMFGNSPIDSGIDDEKIASALDDYEYSELDTLEWEGRHSSMDDASGETLEEIIFRSESLEHCHPFKIESAYLESSSSKGAFSPTELVYLFCLVTSTVPSITTGLYKWYPRIFELLATDLTKCHMGHNAECLHTGWPRSNQLPKKFRALMNELHCATGEWMWNPEDGLPKNPSTRYVKDEGMDFVVWKKSPDNIPSGHLTLIGQAACGNDWNTKFGDIDMGRLRKWFKPMTTIPPIKVFTTPFFLPPASIREASRQAGIVLDRRRLTLIAEQTEWVPSGYLEEVMSELIEFGVER